jgi:addiction module HigA family antidote
MSQSSLQGLSASAREAKSWPFEQARLLLERLLRLRLSDGERDAAMTLIAANTAPTEAARQLGVTRVALSRVLNERAAISPDMALRLKRVASSIVT